MTLHEELAAEQEASTLHEQLAAECEAVGIRTRIECENILSCLICMSGQGHLRLLPDLLAELESRLLDGGSNAVLMWARAIMKTLGVFQECWPETLIIAAVMMTQEQRATAAIAASQEMRTK